MCIRHWDWSETSQTVTLFCREAGLVRGLAKGSKRPRAPFSGGIDALTLGTVGLIRRSGSTLDLITEWDLTETFSHLRRSLSAHHVGLYLADLTQHALSPHDPHPQLFDALLVCLRELADASRCGLAMLRYQLAVVAETGVQPVLDRDAATGGPLPVGKDTYRFSASAGGLVADDERTAPADSWRVRATTVDLIRSLTDSSDNDGGDGADSTMTASGNAGPAADPSTVGRADALLGSYLSRVFGREPPSLRAALSAVGAPTQSDLPNGPSSR